MLHRMTLHLARSHAHPEGSGRHGYEIVAPLDGEGHLDAEEWRSRRSQCRVRRFWAGEPDRHGFLVHRAGGAGGATWLIDYDRETTDDDEAGYRLQSHVFAVDEYVSFREEDGTSHTFKVVKLLPTERPDGVAAA